MRNPYANETEGADAAAGWVAITLRDGNRIAGFATGNADNPKFITVQPATDGPKRTLRLHIGAGTIRAEQVRKEMKSDGTNPMRE